MRLQKTLAAVCGLVTLMACGGSSNNSVNAASTSTSTTPSSVTTVAAICSPASIVSQQTSQCTANVQGIGHFSSTVSWTVSGGGAIDSATGLFTAPTVQSIDQVAITATSMQDTTKSGSTVITVGPAGVVKSVSALCTPSSVQSGQLTTCTASVDGTGKFNPAVTWTATGGTIDPVTGVWGPGSPGTYSVTATSQQSPTIAGSYIVTVVSGVNNVLPVVVDAGPTGDYVNGAFATVRVCDPTASTCQIIDHVLIDTGSVGLRLLAQGAAGGELDPTAFPLEVDANGKPIAECNQFVDGFTWGSVALATIQMAGETATKIPGATQIGVPIQIIGDPRVPPAPSSCTSSALVDESNLTTLGAYGVLGIGIFQQDCGPACSSNNYTPDLYYSCVDSTCTPTLLALVQQLTNPVWTFPNDNNGVLIQLASVPSGGTTAVTGSLIFGVGTQANNGLGTATVLDTDANGYFMTEFSGLNNKCSYIDSGSNANFFPPVGYPGLLQCAGMNSSLYCPLNLMSLSASVWSPTNSGTSAEAVSFNVDSADTLFNNNEAQNTAFSELAGTISTVNGCSSFDWGLSFFYGKSVFTAIEQQPVTGTNRSGPFFAF